MSKIDLHKLQFNQLHHHDYENLCKTMDEMIIKCRSHKRSIEIINKENNTSSLDKIRIMIDSIEDLSDDLQFKYFKLMLELRELNENL